MSTTNNNTGTSDTSTTTNSAPDPNDHGDIQATPDQQEQFRAAYEALADERAALPPDRIIRINADVPTAVSVVLGHEPQIQQLAEQGKGLPGFDATVFEKMERYAQALAYAQMLYNVASTPVENVPELAAEAVKARDRFGADAEALAVRGMLDGSKLQELRGGPGYKNIAYDLGSLVALLRANWSKVAAKTAVTEMELKHAQVLTEQLVMAIAAREQQEAAISAASDERSRAFTLFAHAYDQVRRAASFLHWGENIEDIVPSFYNGRAGTKKSKDTTADTAPAQGTPPSPTTTPATAMPTNGIKAPMPGMPGTTPFAS